MKLMPKKAVVDTNDFPLRRRTLYPAELQKLIIRARSIYGHVDYYNSDHTPKSRQKD